MSDSGILYSESTDQPDNSFDSRIKLFLEKNIPCVYILTPCFGSVCFVSYMQSVMSTIELFRKYRIELHVEFCKNDSLVSRARNNLVARAMNDPKMTHIMFIDNDISWDPIEIIKLLLSEKQLIGGVYPLKYYNWNSLIPDDTTPDNKNIIQSWIDAKNKSQIKDITTDVALIQNRLLKYNVNYLTTTLSINNNTAQVKHIATGFMMIGRDVITQMSTAFPSTKYTDDVNCLRPDENKYAFALFDCGVEDDHYYSEDWLFCNRWSKMGGSIWMDVTISLTHTGIEEYQGRYLSTLI